MTNAAFKLEDSGFSREQVDALSEFMDGSVATKADIAELSGEIKEVRGELKAQGERLDGKITAEIAELSGEIKEVRGELKADIAELSGEIKAQGERLDGEIKAIRTELSGEIKSVRTELIGKINLLYWMLGVSVAGIVSLVIKTFTTS